MNIICELFPHFLFCTTLGSITGANKKELMLHIFDWLATKRVLTLLLFSAGVCDVLRWRRRHKMAERESRLEIETGFETLLGRFPSGRIIHCCRFRWWTPDLCQRRDWIQTQDCFRRWFRHHLGSVQPDRRAFGCGDRKQIPVSLPDSEIRKKFPEVWPDQLFDQSERELRRLEPRRSLHPTYIYFFRRSATRRYFILCNASNFSFRQLFRNRRYKLSWFESFRRLNFK